MTIHVVINSTPKIGLELVSNDLLSGIMNVRVYVAGPSGDFPTVASDQATIFNTGQGPYPQLGEALTYCGITDSPLNWMGTVTKGQAVQALAKWIREVMIPAIVAAIHRVLGATAPPTATGNYTDPKDLFTDALKAIKWTVAADGSVSGTP